MPSEAFYTSFSREGVLSKLVLKYILGVNWKQGFSSHIYKTPSHTHPYPVGHVSVSCDSFIIISPVARGYGYVGCFDSYKDAGSF